MPNLEQDQSGNGHTVTYNDYDSSEVLRKYKTWKWDMFNGADCGNASLETACESQSFGDHDDFSFGTGSITIGGVMLTKDFSSARHLFSKSWADVGGTHTTSEYKAHIDVGERIVFGMYDTIEAVGGVETGHTDGYATCTLQMDTGIAVGWHTFLITHDGTGYPYAGGTCPCDDAVIYVDAVPFSEADGNANSDCDPGGLEFTQMHNLDTELHFWAGNEGDMACCSPLGAYEGETGIAFLSGHATTQSDATAWHNAMRTLYGF